MSSAFLIGFIEALEISLLLVVLASHPGVLRGFRFLLAGTVLGILMGSAVSYLPASLASVHNNDLWSTLRHAAEATIFILPLYVLSLEKRGHFSASSKMPDQMLALMGFFFSVFDARLAGLSVHDAAIILDKPVSTPAIALLGAALALSALLVLKTPGFMEKLRPERFFTASSVLLAAATLRLLTGGVSAIEETHTVEALRLGIQSIVSGLSTHIQQALMLGPLEFIPTGSAGLFEFLTGPQMATTVLVLGLTAPAVSVLMSVLSMPDPDLKGHKLAAHRRLKLAFFRMELVYRGAPPLICFFLVLGALHFVTASVNPMSEPKPVPLEEVHGVLLIPVSGPHGDFSDGMLRKFSYRYGRDVIRFLTIMKPDGTVGVGLDECEICDPPEWNEKARGYAQRGENLVCKYCMTPIPTNSVNRPGGCNPIPLSFAIEDGQITIEIGELVRVWREARKLQKKGTHL